MRVLVVSQYFWPENFQINQLVRTLSSKGVTVEVLTGKPNYPQGKVFPGYRVWGCQEERFNSTAVHRMPLLPRGNRAWQLALNYLSFVLIGLLAGPWLMRGKRFDAIFVFAPSPILQALPALLLGRIKKCPVILWVQDLWPQSLSATGYINNKTVLGWVSLLVRFIYRHTDLLLVQSQAFVEPVRALAAHTPIEYFPNSADDRFFTSTPTATSTPPVKVDGLGSGFSVLFAGNVGKAQAIETIVQAAWLLRDDPHIHFVIMGTGSRHHWTQQEIQRRGLTNLYMPGSFPAELMPTLLRQASVLLVTLADQEIFELTIPSKLQTYMACGRPILAALNGEGAKLVLESGAGLAVKAEDAQALADAVQHLQRLPAQALAAMGECGKTYYQQHFCAHRLVDQLMGHIHRLKANKKW